MAVLVWDASGDRIFETGISKGVLFPLDPTTGLYETGVAWNGLTAVTESPSGAEASPFYADNMKYLSLTSAEEFSATIEAYTYPEEFALCDGSAEIAVGVSISQQTRKQFALVYTTLLGNDLAGNDYGYKIHIIYGATAAPTERGYQTVNDSPEAITFSWELTTNPVLVTGHAPSAHLVIDSTVIPAADLAAIESSLYGAAAAEPTLLLPDAIVTLCGVG